MDKKNMTLEEKLAAANAANASLQKENDQLKAANVPSDTPPADSDSNSPAAPQANAPAAPEPQASQPTPVAAAPAPTELAEAVTTMKAQAKSIADMDAKIAGIEATVTKLSTHLATDGAENDPLNTGGTENGNRAPEPTLAGFAAAESAFGADVKALDLDANEG